MKARLVVCGERTALGGTERVAHYQARALEQRGWTVEWLTPQVITRPRRVKRFPGLNLAFDAFAVSRYLRRLPSAELTFSHGVLGFGARGRRIHTYHGTFAGLAQATRAGLPALDRAVMRWLNGGFEGTSGRGATRVSVSEQARGEVRRYYGLRCQSVIHNGIDTQHFRPGFDREAGRRHWGLPADRYLVLVVGRMDFGKGREVLRELLAQLPEQLLLVLVAPSWSGLEALPRERFIHLPGVAHADLPALYAACDVCLCPSLYEGFGLTALEAWACGLPVVSGRTGVLRELEGQEPSLDTCLRACGDAAGLARAVTRLWREPDLARTQSRWGRELVAREFTVERMAEQYWALAQHAVGSTLATPVPGASLP